ncbi:response regulator transcription factor [Devosia sp.]|uniref:response regulator n=1 Tax=Devosia sp. TaxID=1871048 RepID=UPI001B2B1A02|nr:response regulator transcription factor [Devosia sp.]MBO9589476.1 response regulator transcription factor [Devosia sp.]
MSEVTTVVFVDDHAIFRAGLAQALAASDKISVVAQGGSPADAIELASRHRPDILLLDLWMQRASSVGHIRSILEVSPGTKVVILTASEEGQDVVAAMSEGAAGFVTKETSPDDLIAIINDVQNGETYLSSQSLAGWLTTLNNASKANADRISISALSEQERAVLRAIARGSSNGEVAEHLGISTATVKYHLGRIFVKLGVRNRVEAAVFARSMFGGEA